MTSADAELCLRNTVLFAAISIILSSAEWLRNVQLFEDNGLLSWRILGSRPARFWRSRFANIIFDRSVVRAIFYARLVLCGVLLAGSSVGITAVAATLLLMSSLYITLRTGYGGDGSDQMATVLVIGIVVMSFGSWAADGALVLAGTILIAGQACLSYFVAGAAKLVSPVWRSGTALMSVMSTQTYGHRHAVLLAGGSRTFCTLFCWTVIVTEILFPLVLLAPPYVQAVILAGFALFHLSNAYFMGLNVFVWSFLGSYPSVIVLSHVVRSHLFAA